MTDNQLDDLEAFAGGSITEKWDAARRMMAAKTLISSADNPKIQIGFKALGESAKTSDGLNRLLAIDLIVRISSLVKGLKKQADALLAEALIYPLPSASLVSDARNLPAEAKSAEVRENIAMSLAYASGDWVVPYIIATLASEDRSQRCRLELARQLAAREKIAEKWFAALSVMPISKILPKDKAEIAGVGRLKDITAAFSEVVRERRGDLKAGASVGAELARLCRAFVQIMPRMPLPKRLDEAAAQVAWLLDDLLAVRVDLIAEPDSYAPLGVFQQWWSPLPYPDVLAEACRPLVGKLVGAITLRARIGQRSESLVSRLTQAVGISGQVKQMLEEIANSETGLNPDIDDWLRGLVRETSATTEAVTLMLAGVNIESLVLAIAPMILEASEAEQEMSQGKAAEQQTARIISQIRAIAASLRLEITGKIGETLDYAPEAHRTVTGALPREHRVRMLRPMVIRRRTDGGVDIIEKAVVTDL